MKRQYFGTDGVRGPYGGPVVNDAFAQRLGAAAGRWLQARGPAAPTAPGASAAGRKAVPPIVLIGRDTRWSGPALVEAVAAGLAREGITPVSLGILPTPAVARAVRTEGAALGVVVTASHNPAADNGIKFFAGTGVKLTDEEEAQIEELLDSAGATADAATPEVRLPGCTDFAGDYIGAVSRLLPARGATGEGAPGGILEGWRIVLDAAHGATCVTSPLVLRALGATVIGLGDAPDGRNINAGVGSEHPESLCAAVRAAGARLGIAHDGDGDRCVLCDEGGELLDGDEILTILAVHALRRGALAGNTLVVTVQSNLGVDAAVQAAGGRVLRTPVGDRYVSERMLAEGAMLGGESSGHIICAEVSPTGDGLVAALKVIEVMLLTGQPLSELRRVLRKFPQLVSALPVGAKPPLESLAAVQAAIRAVEAELGPRGRVLVRYSGTEPKIRLLVEGEDAAQVQSCFDRLAAAVRADLPSG
ncbi:MAG TPA: phosphoglucosamine mutase [Opitutaceae bacterium]|nr:phosphoglucosamine mutase [Opitutaceae bacterium]